MTALICAQCGDEVIRWHGSLFHNEVRRRDHRPELPVGFETDPRPSWHDAPDQTLIRWWGAS